MIEINSSPPHLPDHHGLFTASAALFEGFLPGLAFETPALPPALFTFSNQKFFLWRSPKVLSLMKKFPSPLVGESQGEG
ncbi:MAG: hypothetical protein ACYC6G_19525 [Desulfobaccales bacterium]